MLTTADEFNNLVFSPVEEVAAYEALWTKYSTVKQLADLFSEFQHSLPSIVASRIGIPNNIIESIKAFLNGLLPFSSYRPLLYGDFEYPEKLRDARYPVEVLYVQGNIDLLFSPSVSIVGSRKPSDEGVRRARKLARLLVENDYTVMSGLATGIDTAAHMGALEAEGRSVAVIGTPLSEVYPKENRELQKRLATHFAVVSQVPFYFHQSLASFNARRGFFPERNKTMSALSQATVIVEAGETSGSLIQAKAALQQGRKLFILNSCFESGLQWPEKLMRSAPEGSVVRVVNGSEIIEHLAEQRE